MKIKVNPDLFNPLYWHLQKYLSDPNIRMIILRGGSSAAKTFSVVQSILFQCTLQEASSTIVFKKVSADIISTIYPDFKGQIESYNLGELFTCQQNLIKCVNGEIIRFKGLDDNEKSKGLSGFKRVFMEELTQFDLQDLRQIRKRLRGKVGQQIIAAFNPVEEEHWVNVDLLQKYTWSDVSLQIEDRKYSKLDDTSFIQINEEGNAIYVKTTYLDNYWIVGHPDKPKLGFYDKHTIEDYEFDKKTDFNFYNIYALAEWGHINKGGEFYKEFKPEIHVENNDYNPLLPLHISFDENVNPYLSAQIWQIGEKRAVCIDEIALKSPRNTLNATCKEIKSRYRLHKTGMFIYGDATSRKQDTKLEKGQNFFTLIMGYLSLFRPTLRVPKSNPAVVMRGNFINTIFQIGFQEIEIVISEQCKHTIADLSHLKEASDGRKFKELTRDKVTKVTYEKYGHMSDCLDYLICKVFSVEYSSYISGGRKATYESIPMEHNSDFTI